MITINKLFTLCPELIQVNHKSSLVHSMIRQLKEPLSEDEKLTVILYTLIAFENQNMQNQKMIIDYVRRYGPELIAS